MEYEIKLWKELLKRLKGWKIRLLKEEEDDDERWIRLDKTIKRIIKRIKL